MVVLISYDSKLYTLILSKIYRFFEYFLFPKTIRFEFRDSRNIQGFALIYEQSCYWFENVACLLHKHGATVELGDREFCQNKNKQKKCFNCSDLTLSKKLKLFGQFFNCHFDCCIVLTFCLMFYFWRGKFFY